MTAASRPSADLTIPPAAIAVLREADPDREVIGDRDVEPIARAVALPVVAQFLRDLAARHDRVSGDLLAELADGLDPQAGDEDGADQ